MPRSRPRHTVTRNIGDAELVAELSLIDPHWTQLPQPEIDRLVAAALGVRRPAFLSMRNDPRDITGQDYAREMGSREDRLAETQRQIAAIQQTIVQPGGLFDQAIDYDRRRTESALYWAEAERADQERRDRFAAAQLAELREAANRLEDAQRPEPAPSPAAALPPLRWWQR